MKKYFSMSGSEAFNFTLDIKGEDESQIVLTSISVNTGVSNIYMYSVNQTELESSAQPKTLTANAFAGGNTVTVSSIAGLGIGGKICIKSQKNTISLQEIRNITNVVGLVLTLDAPLTHSYRVGAIVYNMNRVQQIPFTAAYTYLQGECLASTEVRKSPMQVAVYGTRAIAHIAGYWHDIN